MGNKLFFVALIISLLFHLWVIPFFLLPLDMKEYQIKEEKPAVSIRMTFFHSDSSAQPAGERIDKFLPEDREIADYILVRDINVGQKKTLVENVQEEIVKNVEDSLPVIKEMTEQEEAIEKKTNEKIKKEGQSDIKAQNNKKARTSEEKDETSSFQSGGFGKDRMNENNQSEGEELPLDLTQSDFSDSQVIPLKIVSFDPPDYPENLRKREIEGCIQLRVLIDKTGKAVQVEIEKSSGYQAFDQAARQSVHRWQFKPAQFGDQERASWVLIPVVFQLE